MWKRWLMIASLMAATFPLISNAAWDIDNPSANDNVPHQNLLSAFGNGDPGVTAVVLVKVKSTALVLEERSEACDSFSIWEFDSTDGIDDRISHGEGGDGWPVLEAILMLYEEDEDGIRGWHDSVDFNFT